MTRALLIAFIGGLLLACGMAAFNCQCCYVPAEQIIALQRMQELDRRGAITDLKYDIELLQARVDRLEKQQAPKPVLDSSTTLQDLYKYLNRNNY